MPVPHSAFAPGAQPPQLVLYKYDACPYCQKVMREIARLGITTLTMRDTMQDPTARQELLAKGGKTQVPCLVINGRALYESDAIIAYLKTLSRE